MTKQEVLKIIDEKTPIEIIIEIEPWGKDWQVVGEVGGDILTYRVHEDGSLGMK